MKKIFIFTCSLFIVACSALHHSSPPGVFIPPKPDEWVMPNGIKVLFLENRELPLVEGALYIPGGGLWETKLGVSSAMGSMMRSGGAGSYSPRSLDAKLKELAAQVGTTWGDEYGVISFSSLTSTLDEVLSIYGDVLLHPQFDATRFETYKRQVIDSIQRRKDDPETVAKLSLSAALFPQSAFGKIPVVKDVQALSRDDLLSRYRELVTPEGSVMAITGDISKSELSKKLNLLFEHWSQSPVKKDLTPPAISTTPKKGLYFVNQNLKQSTVMVGQRSLPRGHADRFKLELFNNIFGLGGFGSRLTQEVRTKAGLSYVIYGGSVPGLVAGQNFLSLQTKSESTGLALKKSFEILKDLQTTPPPVSELEESKEGLMNSFIFRYQTPSSTITRIATQMMLRVPRTFDEQYAREVPLVAPEGVKEVANRWWKPDDMVVVVVGTKEALRTIQKAGPPEVRRLPVFEGKFDEVFSSSK